MNRLMCMCALVNSSCILFFLEYPWLSALCAYISVFMLLIGIFPKRSRNEQLLEDEAQIRTLDAN
jgi:hypothetical protein